MVARLPDWDNGIRKYQSETMIIGGKRIKDARLFEAEGAIWVAFPMVRVTDDGQAEWSPLSGIHDAA